MLKLLSIQAEGFKNLKIKVPIPFPAEGNILVFGPNESGKSSLFEAVFFALFGKLLVKHKHQSLVDGIHFLRNKASVELRFLKDERECLIRREISRTGSGASENVIFQMYNEGTPENYSSSALNKAEIQRKIEDFLGFDGDILLNSCFVKQKDLDGFIGGTKKQMDAVIHKLLGMEKITELQSQYREEMKTLEVMTEFLDNKLNIENKKKQIVEIHSKSIGLRENCNQYEKIKEVIAKIDRLNLDDITNNLDQIEKTIHEQEDEINSLKEALAVIDKNLELLEKQEELEKDITNEQKILKKIEEAHDHLKDEIQEVEIEINNHLIKEVDRFYVNLDEYGTLLNDIKKLKEEIEENNNLLETWNHYQKGLTKIKDLENEIQKNQLLIEIQVLQFKKEELRNAKEGISSQIKETNNLKDTREIFEKISALTDQINNLKINLDIRNKAIQQMQDELNTNEAKTQEFTDDIQTLKDNLNQKELKLIAAEKFIHQTHLNQINIAINRDEQKNLTLMRFFFVIGCLNILIGSLLGVIIHGVLFSIAAGGAILAFLGILIGKNIIQIGSSNELNEAINSFKRYLTISPPHQSKFIDPNNLTGPAVQTLQSLIENQIRLFDNRIGSDYSLQDIQNYYYHSVKDFNFNLFDEITSLKDELEQAIQEPFGLSQYEKRKTELKILIGEEEQKQNDILKELRKLEETCKESQVTINNKQVPTWTFQELEGSLQKLQQKFYQITSDENATSNSLTNLTSKVENLPDQINSAEIHDRIHELNQELKTLKEMQETIKLPEDFTEATFKDLQTQEANLKDIKSKKEVKIEDSLKSMDEIWSNISNNAPSKDKTLDKLKQEADKYLKPLQRERQTYLEQLQTEFKLQNQNHYATLYEKISPQKYQKIREKIGLIEKKEAEIKNHAEKIERDRITLNQIKNTNTVELHEKPKLESNQTQLNQKINQLSNENIKVKSEKSNLFQNVKTNLEELKSDLISLKDIPDLKHIISLLLQLDEISSLYLKKVHHLLHPIQALFRQLMVKLESEMQKALGYSSIPGEKTKFKEEIMKFSNQEEILNKEISIAEENIRNLLASKEKNKRIENYTILNDGTPYSELIIQIKDQKDILKTAQNFIEIADERLTKKVLPTTCQFLARILPILTAGRYKDLEIQHDKGKFHVLVFDSSKKEYVEKVLFSGGTNDQIALAIRLAFAMAVMTGTKYDESFIFLDEPLGFFDDERKNYLIDFLTKGWIAERFAQRFVVSNFSSIKKYFDHIIEMENGMITDILDIERPDVDHPPVPPEVNYLGLELTKPPNEDPDGYCEYLIKLKNITGQNIQKISLFSDEINSISPKIIYGGLKINEEYSISIEFNRNSLDKTILTIHADLEIGSGEIKTDILKFDIVNEE